MSLHLPLAVALPAYVHHQTRFVYFLKIGNGTDQTMWSVQETKSFKGKQYQGISFSLKSEVIVYRKIAHMKRTYENARLNGRLSQRFWEKRFRVSLKHLVVEAVSKRHFKRFAKTRNLYCNGRKSRIAFRQFHQQWVFQERTS